MVEKQGSAAWYIVQRWVLCKRTKHAHVALSANYLVGSGSVPPTEATKKWFGKCNRIEMNVFINLSKILEHLGLKFEYKHFTTLKLCNTEIELIR